MKTIPLTQGNRAMSLKLTDTMIKVAMFLGDYGESGLSRELFSEIERLLADERKDVLMEILALNCGLGCTPQEGYKDLTDALRDTKHLIARAQRDEREKVREMCAEYLEKEAAKCAGFADIEAGERRAAWNRAESWYQDSADAIRQLDLTKDLAASSREEKV